MVYLNLAFPTFLVEEVSSYLLSVEGVEFLNYFTAELVLAYLSYCFK